MQNQHAGIQFVHTMYYDPIDGEIQIGPDTMTVDEYTDYAQRLKAEHDVVYLHTGRRAYDNPIDYETMELIPRVEGANGEYLPAADPNPAELTRAKQRFAAHRKKLPIPDPVRPPDAAATGDDRVLVRNVYDSTVYADSAISLDGRVRGRIHRKGKAFVSEDEARQLELKDLVVRVAS